MKQFLALTLTAVTLGGLFTGCSGTASRPGGEPGGKGEVNVFNWGEYIDESLLETFEEQTGIKVNYKTFPDNETLYSTLQSSMGEYDVIIPSDYMIARMIDEEMLERIDLNNIPNYEKISDSYKHLDYDPGNEYSVPYTWGTVGLIYNTTMVSEAPTSWKALWDEQYKGQILMFDNSRDCIGIALKVLGYSFNTTDEAQIKEAVDLLIEQAPLVQAYVMDQIFDKLEVGEAAMGPYYAGDAITMMESNPDLAFVLPEEGANLFVDAMCIPKGAPNKENAEAFINFMCSDEAAVANCEYIGYSTPSDSAREKLEPELAQNPIAYPDEETLSRCETFINLPEEILKLYDSEWLRLKGAGG
ncbi:spermidine/putrescine ABC transporter substrate-binding protein [Pseudoflavonifractor sp. 524-17]|uniref:ABC transporter substrate-binding protein n=1 Tax=Pseudoflavonifractor sp. 524-17 TaxID=2304577 RepID=UPI00137A3017|nr:spermidine/putrescine ABC transporter substrate-binding protein [Pseudoflavonifractor sp. 524-17]NCE63256.1 spermidine/putrescine ABC transporter substrate-binding protein [Pseudoflavonifractor sp. 524-17]